MLPEGAETHNKRCAAAAAWQKPGDCKCITTTTHMPQARMLIHASCRILHSLDAGAAARGSDGSSLPAYNTPATLGPAKLVRCRRWPIRPPMLPCCPDPACSSRQGSRHPKQRPIIPRQTSCPTYSASAACTPRDCMPADRCEKHMRMVRARRLPAPLRCRVHCGAVHAHARAPATQAGLMCLEAAMPRCDNTSAPAILPRADTTTRPQ